MRFLPAVLLAVLLLALLVVFAGRAATTGMVLTQDNFSNGAPGTQIERDAPRYCYHEDSSHVRTWDGTLAPGQSFSVPLRFCTNDEWPYGPSGEGFYYRVLFWEGHQSVSLKVIFPDGSVKQANHTYDGALEGCVVPPIAYSDRETGTFKGFIAPGTYQVVLTNTGSKPISASRPLSEMSWVRMGDLWFQNGVCPAADRNIVAAKSVAPVSEIAPTSVCPNKGRVLLCLHNYVRHQHGLDRLHWKAPSGYTSPLYDGARHKWERIQECGQFSHTPCGDAPFLEYFLAGFPVDFSYGVGENIAVGYSGARAVMAAWLASPGHRANILNPAFNEFGSAHGDGASFARLWVVGLGGR